MLRGWIGVETHGGTTVEGMESFKGIIGGMGEEDKGGSGLAE
jgi:hypothetical protein